MSESTTRPGICRICSAHCGVLATVTDGKLVRVTGDPQNPLYQGFTCGKGRALPEIHNSPDRLLHSRKRQTTGDFTAIDVEVAMDEIAARLQQIIDEYGPRAVAVYVGTAALPYPTGPLVANAFTRAIDSPMFFTSNSIDQPGKQIAQAAHGHWLGGDILFDDADSWILVGTNPLVTKAAGIPGQNPFFRLRQALKRGMKLIVIDPRVSQTAWRATVHIQPRPGEDASILACLVNIIISEKLCDTEFLSENVVGFDALAAAVAPFTPEYVGKRADVPAQQLVDAARLFADSGSRPGQAHGATGINFSKRGNLTEYLCLVLTTIVGSWQRAGQQVAQANVLMPPFDAKAQAFPPYPGWGYGEKMRVRGLVEAASGMPTSALSEEILLDGDGQVKALICVGSNPMTAWADEQKTYEALQKLDLLVTIDTHMALTAALADYVIAPKVHLEVPASSQMAEQLKYYSSGMGMQSAYAQYSPRLVEPPADSDLTEEWLFFRGLAKRMDLALDVVNFFGSYGGQYMEGPPAYVRLEPDTDITTEQLIAEMCATSRIPLDDVATHQHGHIYDIDAVVKPKDPGCTDKLDVGNAHMMSELGDVRAENFGAVRDDPAYPLRLIPRRHKTLMNSLGTTIAKLNDGRPFNTVFMHPDTIAALGLHMDAPVTVSSAHGSIPSVVESDRSLRADVVAMHHGFGGLPTDREHFLKRGSNVCRLVDAATDFDPITGIPWQGNIPVSITPREH
jgi:anaerobic selenocysteine-containing dehydrogenase